MQRSLAGSRPLHAALAHLVAPVALAIACVTGCSSTQDAASTTSPPDASTDAGCTPHEPSGMLPANISFRSDLMPLFAQSCSLFRYCHGRDGSQGDLYLGPGVLDAEYPPNDAIFAEVRAALVDAPAVRAVTMVRVAAGSPEDSFLMHKVDTDQNCSSILCKDPLSGNMGTDLCGDKMPPENAMPLEMAKADMIRAWIMDGAPDN